MSKVKVLLRIDQQPPWQVFEAKKILSEMLVAEPPW